MEVSSRPSRRPRSLRFVPTGQDSGVDRPTGDWTARITENIRRAEYEFSWQRDGTLSAPNRAHDLRSALLPTGLRVVSRTKGAEPADGGWELTLSLSAFGRESELAPLAEPELENAGERAEIRRGGITEWYTNTDAGLEQGFAIAAPPGGSPKGAQGARVVLEMALGGGLKVYPAEDDQSVRFVRSGGGAVLIYSQLRVRDAEDRPLPARMQIVPADAGRDAALRLIFDDEGAIYPVTVDPLLTTFAWAVEGDQLSDQYGVSVATAGDVNGDGYSDVIVGANFYDNGEANEGRAYVHYGSASGLNTTPAWTAESNQASAFFGHAVSTAGDVNADGYADVIIGAYGYDNVEVDEGAAFVWLGSASGLGASGTPVNADWRVESNQASAELGRTVGWAGDVNGDGTADVIVGAWKYDKGQTDEGIVLVFHGSTSNPPITHAGLITLIAIADRRSGNALLNSESDAQYPDSSTPG